MKPRTVSENEWTFTFLGLAIFFGAIARFLPAYISGFPVNDGGMFAVMMRDLQNNHFALPQFTTYNNAQIPYAYPPLGFYIGASLQLTSASPFQILRWLPFLFSTLEIPLFYFLAAEWTQSRPRAALASVFFALTPGRYIWQIMGGGLTRALGLVFLLPALTFTLRAFQNARRKDALLAALFCGLTILSHPQAAFLAFIGCAILWLFFGRSPGGARRAAAIGAGAALLSAPWWAGMILTHGWGIFSPLGSMGTWQDSLRAILTALITRATLLPFGMIFTLMGLGWAIWKRRFALLVWGFLPYFIDLRSAAITAALMYSILAAHGIIDALPALWRALPRPQSLNFFNQRALSISLLALTFYFFLETVFYAQVAYTITLTPAMRQVAQWAKNNTPPESEFLLLTGRADIMTDPLLEWFPALSGRRSASTLQGQEWVLRRGFTARWRELSALQTCRSAACVFNASRDIPLQYDYLVLKKRMINPAEFPQTEYQILYDAGGYIVMQKKSQR